MRGANLPIDFSSRPTCGHQQLLLPPHAAASAATPSAPLLPRYAKQLPVLSQYLGSAVEMKEEKWTQQNSALVLAGLMIEPLPEQVQPGSCCWLGAHSAVSRDSQIPQEVAMLLFLLSALVLLTQPLGYLEAEMRTYSQRIANNACTMVMCSSVQSGPPGHDGQDGREGPWGDKGDSGLALARSVRSQVRADRLPAINAVALGHGKEHLIESQTGLGFNPPPTLESFFLTYRVGMPISISWIATGPRCVMMEVSCSAEP
ncbi:hypothetical protein P7K49_023526 [Saguinus oedipus]|uniref:Uncharacterized protein n=1 Tax=Saguinus oedipus TaxID=9490 RepID=A0ABQ9ULW9_SAGOE|nr:hypothetical protein P7K49_023526 [Saguinus oedipus]